MAGSVSWTPIPSSPPQPANAATINAPITQVVTGINNHLAGVAGFRSALAEIDSILLDNTASAPIIATTATDLNTRALQFAESLAKIAVGTTSVTTWAAAINNLAATANLANHDALLGASTTAAGARTALGAAKSGANTDITSIGTLASLTVTGALSAGTITGSFSGTAGNITGVLTAASHPALTGDVTNAQGSLATTVAAVGGSSATSVAAAATAVAAATNLNTASSLVRRDASGNFTAGTITANLTGNISGLASNITGVLTAASMPILVGDVTTAGGSLATTVATVGGSTAANVRAAELLANAATSANAVSTIVRRDVSGNFIAGTITANLTGNVTGNATNISGILAATSHPALTGDVSSGQGATTVAVVTVGGVSAANVAAGAGAANNATNLNTALRLVARDSAGNFAAGTIAANLTGNVTGNVTGNAATATNVAASGITGTLGASGGGTGLASYTPYAILAANATGTGLAPIAPGANATYLQISGGVPIFAGLSATIADYSLSLKKLSDGAVIPTAPATMRVYVNAAKKFDGAGNPVQWSGDYLDLTSYVPGTGTSAWVMIYLNATAAVYAAPGAASATPTKPQAVGGQTPLAYVLMYAGMTTVASADIYDWRTDFAAFAVGGGTGSGYSPVGHYHGQGGESFVAIQGIDEGRPTTPSVAGLTVYVQPMRYSDLSGAVQNYPGGATPAIARPVSYPYYAAIGLSQAGGLTITYGAENATPVRGGFLNTTDIPICYVLVRTGSTRTILNDDSTNALILDARRTFTFASNAAGGVSAVSNGGTGQSSFAASGLLYTAGGATAFTTIAATTGTALGFALTPTLTPAGGNTDLVQLGGGVIATGATNITTANGLHIMAATKTGTGTITNFNAVTIEAPTVAIGTNLLSLNVLGNAAVSGNMSVGGGLTFTGAFAVSAASAAGALQVNTTSPTGLGIVVNAITGQTALLESWRVNSVEQASMSAGGVLTVKGVVNSGAESIGTTLGVTGATTLSGGGTLTGSFGGTYTLGGTPTITAPAIANPTMTGGGSLAGTYSGNHIMSGQVSFTNVSAPIITASIGPSATQQHILPVIASDTIALLAAAQTLTNKTLTAPVLGGSVTGVYTLAGTPTITAPAITNPTITGGGSIAGTFGGTPTLSGAVTFSATGTALNVTNNATVGGTLAVTGATTLAGVTATSMANSGNETVGGTLGVTGATTLATVGATNGTFSGTLGVTGIATFTVAPVFTATAATRVALGLQYWDMSGFSPLTPAVNAIVDKFRIPRGMAIPSGFTGGTYANTNVATTATIVFTIYKGTGATGAATSIGTITFTSSVNGVFASAAGAVTLAANDYVYVQAPASMTGFTGDLDFTIAATY